MKTADERIMRALDANFNRTREGLRVCEDIARFIMDSKRLTEELKTVRHKVSTIRKEMPLGARLMASRDVEGDIGKDLNIRSRTRRGSCGDIFNANMQRVKESLRVLEEFIKLSDEKTARKISRLRFTVYKIEKDAVIDTVRAS